jgi:ankyrin repeat protein
MFVSQEGRTALMWAAMNGHTEAVKALIEVRSYKDAKDEDAKEKVRQGCLTDKDATEKVSEDALSVHR